LSAVGTISVPRREGISGLTFSTNLGLLWLVIFAIAMSAVSLYYYLQVLKEIYVVEARVDAPLIRATAPFTVAVVLIALGVVVLGCAPNLLIGKLSAAIQLAGFQ